MCCTQVFNDESHHLNVYGSNVEVDYRGYEVTVENFMRVLTGYMGGTWVELCCMRVRPGRSAGAQFVVNSARVGSDGPTRYSSSIL
jgi:hypothetical protein